MKRIFLLAAALLTVSVAANAQEFNKGDWAVNAGISLENTDPILPGGSVEYGLIENTFGLQGLTFGVGAEVGFWSQKVVGIKTTGLALGVRAPFHYSPVNKLDLYTAPAIVHVRAKTKGLGTSSDTQFGWAILGARYFFSSNFGVFAEFGMDNALETSAGVSFRF